MVVKINGRRMWLTSRSYWAKEGSILRVASLSELARAEGFCDHYAARLAPLAFLAPNLADEILDGRQLRALSLGALTARGLPVDWTEQRRLFADYV